LGHRGTDSERLDVLHGLFSGSVAVIRSIFICRTLVQSGQCYQLDLDFGGIERRMLYSQSPYLCFTLTPVLPVVCLAFSAMNLTVTPVDAGY